MQEGEAQDDVVGLPPDLRTGTARVSAHKGTLCLMSFCVSNLISLIKGRKKKREVFSTVLSEALIPGFSEALIAFTK